jgi:lipoprotein NlpI
MLSGLAKRDKRDVEGALADFTRSVELDPKNADGYFNRGFCRFETRDWTNALADFRRYCELGTSGQEYLRLYIWLTRARLGETDTANEELSAYLDRRPKSAGDEWYLKAAAFLMGKLPEADFLAAAAIASDASTKADPQCEAWFFAGMKKVLAGDKIAAADYFRKSLATEKKTCVAYRFAEAELKALGK